ncbi:hypothetical protein SEA_MODRAGONS_70 [Mycobacterium phage Modragons]|uniref:DUF1508 domain-containing protein n=1 Tax=Mycobacterium phage Ochi17 TaxID=2502425 RepID=A0A411BTI5_9CAUD|nr:hypothetical protein PBI_LLAMA_71 [Mycobacterium phage Llama]YP_010101084.1 hypothetical protein KNU45_gp070 [Mycobacterium phage Ochi17]QFP96453.1 hypothetical protein SEA_MODRAGONS_70 [Mycobacterium phage Modragons]QOP67155.1 hypothetical protein SEA_SEABASTIAN_72 [Mycobacterium phage Seabastian]QOP67266.1 hypothetical protein SEA_OFULTRON_72 [Mycobacterium phage OfUltron]WNM64890.1 hypothetical protein SEA_ALPINESIX_72 [Mycobacterium phage AlpineSix]AIM51013.1 hypothetical protein PBI_L
MNRPVFYVDQKEDLEKGTFWWTVATSNGQVILTSEPYSRRRDARKAARRFITHTIGMVVFRYHDRNGERVQSVLINWHSFAVAAGGGGGGGGVSVGGGGNGEAFGTGARFQ